MMKFTIRKYYGEIEVENVESKKDIVWHYSRPGHHGKWTSEEMYIFEIDTLEEFIDWIEKLNENVEISPLSWGNSYTKPDKNSEVVYELLIDNTIYQEF
jgi:hypothetical protein